MPPSPPPSPGSPVASGQTTTVEPAANFVRLLLVVDEALYCANKATFDANVCSQIACTQWYCRCILDLKSGYVCPSSRRRALSQTPSSAGQLQVTAALPPTYTSAFADVQKYAGWLVGEPKVGQGDVPVSSASGPSTGTLSTSFVAAVTRLPLAAAQGWSPGRGDQRGHGAGLHHRVQEQRGWLPREEGRAHPRRAHRGAHVLGFGLLLLLEHGARDRAENHHA